MFYVVVNVAKDLIILKLEVFWIVHKQQLLQLLFIGKNVEYARGCI